MSNLLDKFRSAGVLTFTVQNNEATADNPYEQPESMNDLFPSQHRQFDELNLPPLPTSGIPDGPVKIEEVEEVKQWLNSGNWQTWYQPRGVQTRIALAPKALRKGEEEKPEEKCPLGCKHYTGGEIRHIKECPFYPDSLSRKYDEMEQELSERLQPEKMEQTAEGVEVEKLNGELDQMTFDIEVGLQVVEELKQEINELKALNESQLAQYKERLIAELEAELDYVHQPVHTAYIKSGIRKAIDLIKKS